MSSQCNWDTEEYVHQSLERTCRPTHQLLMQVKQSVASIYAQLMTINCSVRAAMWKRNSISSQHLDVDVDRIYERRLKASMPAS